MKRCFKCNQIVDNYVNICPGCGNNYFLPERTNSIDSNIVMQQVMPQKQNEEGSTGMFLLGMLCGTILNLWVLIIIQLLLKKNKKTFTHGALVGILIAFIVTILYVTSMPR